MEAIAVQNIKGYELHERIGAGGFGAVYRAYQTTVGREVAIKIILPGLANQPEFIRRFEAEAQLIARLEHPHITPLYDYWRDPEGAYLVMRWLRGGSLRDALQNGAFDLRTAATLLEQIAGALSLAHRNNVIHRDIKPGNILLDEDGNAYLTDFGIAKDLNLDSQGTQSDMIVGSMDYISPEQARSEAVTPRTDIYSLGVTLYEIITGHHPFENVSSVERLYKHINDPLPEITIFDPSQAAAINLVIQRATAKNPGQRYTDALTLAAEFRNAVSAGNTPASIVEFLTQREQDILALLAAGLSNKEIAQRLTITMNTVKWYITQIYSKLGVRSRVQAMVRARELNLLTRQTEVSIAVPLPTEDFHPENPYKGLRAFRSADYQDFFGREKITAKLLKEMSKAGEYSRFLGIVGPSGSGKSSLVKAGLIPALWRGELPGSEKWFIVEMLPGAHPLEELEIALTKIAVHQGANLHEHLRRDQRGLLRSASLILPDDESELLIVIDQFEEVFTLVEDEAQRIQFLDLLYTAVTEPRSRVRIVITLRADFYDRPLHYPQFGEMLRNRLETIMPLSAEELERAIAKPAERVGMIFEPGLMASIVSDVNYQPGALPLLQYALTELFEQRQGRLLTREAYHAIGGTVGALAKRADELYASLDKMGQEAARQIFMRLVTLGEGTDDTRRRVARSELLAITNDPDNVEEILDTYTEYRLLSVDHDPVTRTPTVEVAHEALLREWERLRAWLNDSRGEIRLQRQLAQAAVDWDTAKQDTSFLLRGSRLELFEHWAAETGLAVTPPEREFLRASLAEREREMATQKAQEAREAALTQRAQRVLQGLVAVFLVAALIAGGLALWANSQRNHAEDEKTRAEQAEDEALRQASIGLAALALQELYGASPERGVMLALEALEYYPYTPQAESALAEAVEVYVPYQNLYRDSDQAATHSAWSPDGQRIATGQGRPAILDANTGRVLLEVSPLPGCSLNDLAWSPDGQHLVYAATQGTAGLQEDTCEIAAGVLDATTGETVFNLERHEVDIVAVDWSNDGSLILTAGADGTARLWDTETGEEQLTLSISSAPLTAAEWSPTGDRVAASAEDGIIYIWDAHTGNELAQLTGHTGSIRGLDWSPDGTRLVTAGEDATGRIWEVSTGRLMLIYSGHSASVWSVDWSPQGDQIATVSRDGSLRVWDATTGEELLIREGIGTIRGEVAWSPSGNQLITSTPVLYVFDLASQPIHLSSHPGLVPDAQWSPDSTLIVTSSYALGADSYALLRISEGATGKDIIDLDPKAVTGYFSWSPDGQRLATPGWDGTLRIWNAADWGVLLEIPGRLPHHIHFAASWSPDGSTIALNSWDTFGNDPATVNEASHPVLLFDAETGEELGRFENQDCHQHRPAWSPDSRFVITGCVFAQQPTYPDGNTPAFIWDALTGELVATLPSEYGWTFSGEWSLDGTRILTTYQNGAVMVWDATTHELLYLFVGHTNRIWDATWSPNGTRIASGDETGVVRIWDPATGNIVRTFKVPGNVLSIHWSPDGTKVIVTGHFPTPVIRRAWQSTNDLIEYAYECCVTRELTPEERMQFGLPLHED